MRKNTITTILVAFVLVLVIASPMPNGEIQSTLENPISEAHNVASGSGNFAVAWDADDVEYMNDVKQTTSTICRHWQHWWWGTRIYETYISMEICIPKDALILSASITVWVVGNGGNDAIISRIDETDVGSLEGGESEPIITDTNSITDTDMFTSKGWQTSDSVADMVQDQVNLPDWESRNHIGFAFKVPDGNKKNGNAFEDHQHEDQHPAYLSVAWTTDVEPLSAECTNLDDGDNLYNNSKVYTFVTTVLDPCDNVKYVWLKSFDYGSTTVRWNIRWIRSTDTHNNFNPEKITVPNVHGVRNGITWTITFYIVIEDGHGTYSDDDLSLFSWDSVNTGSEYFDTNYDYIMT